MGEAFRAIYTPRHMELLGKTRYTQEQQELLYAVLDSERNIKVCVDLFKCIGDMHADDRLEQAYHQLITCFEQEENSHIQALCPFLACERSWDRLRRRAYDAFVPLKEPFMYTPLKDVIMDAPGRATWLNQVRRRYFSLVLGYLREATLSEQEVEQGIYALIIEYCLAPSEEGKHHTGLMMYAKVYPPSKLAKKCAPAF